MNSAWPTLPLGQIAEFEGGSQPPKSEFIYEQRQGYVRFLQIRDFKSEKNVTYIKASSKNRICSDEDILIGRYGASVGQILTGKAGAYNVALMKAMPDMSVVTPRYFYHYLNSEHFQRRLMSVADRSAQNGFSKEDIAKFPVLVPPLPEQKRIVAILDEAFAGIAAATANAEKNLANARELFDLSLETIFTEEGAGRVQRPFSDICEITSKLVDPREPSFIDLPHLGAGNMVSKTGELIEIKTAREEELKSGKFLFDESVVLYSKIRPYLMKACRPDFSGLCSADVYPLLPKPALLDRNFLFYLLLSRKFTEFAIAGSDRAGMPKVNRDHLFSYKAWLPDVKEQRLLASKLDKISSETNRIELIYQRKIAALAELKQAILQKAFSGELTALPEAALQEEAA